MLAGGSTENADGLVGALACHVRGATLNAVVAPDVFAGRGTVGIPRTVGFTGWVGRIRVRKIGFAVVSILTATAPPATLTVIHGLTIAEIEGWQEAFLSGAESALLSPPLDEAAMKEAQFEKLKQKVGALVMERDVWTRADEAPPCATSRYPRRRSIGY